VSSTPTAEELEETLEEFDLAVHCQRLPADLAQSGFPKAVFHSWTPASGETLFRSSAYLRVPKSREAEPEALLGPRGGLPSVGPISDSKGLRAGGEAGCQGVPRYRAGEGILPHPPPIRAFIRSSGPAAW